MRGWGLAGPFHEGPTFGLSPSSGDQNTLGRGPRWGRTPP